LVETLGVEPTVVKTGDAIQARYRLRFPDLVPTGREILILEDRLAPQTLPVSPFEALSLDVVKRQVGDQYVWDLTYRLRIIKAVKAAQMIPGFSIYWLVRDLGQSVEKAAVQQVNVEPLVVRHVTTLTDVPVLDIRDSVELGDYRREVMLLRTIAWGVAPLPLLIWMLQFVRVVRMRRIQRREQPVTDERAEPLLAAAPTLGAARRSVRNALERLRALPPSTNGQALHDVHRAMVISFREYLLAELPELSPGHTARDIKHHVDTKLSDDARRPALGALSSRLEELQQGLERGAPVPSADPAAEAAALEDWLRELRPYTRVWRAVSAWRQR
jgi:hypothetical protein